MGCFSTKPTADQFRNFLWNNFYRHYDTNKAPMGVFLHSAFLKNDPAILDTFLTWIDQVSAEHPDDYFVTMTQALLWIQDPVTSAQATNYEAWQEACIPVGEPACPGT